MDQAKQKKIIASAIESLRQLDIDAFILITSEGSEKALDFIPGVGTVGSGAFLFSSKGKKFAVCSSIDAQDIEESGLFDAVFKYQSFDETLHDVVARIAPKSIALNFSSEDPFCDGLTVGRYRRFKKTVADLGEMREVSSALFLPALRRANP